MTKLEKEAKEKAEEIEKRLIVGVYSNDEDLARDEGYNSGYVVGYEEGYIAGAEIREKRIKKLKKENAELEKDLQWHNLKKDPTDLPQCKEDEQIIFYVKEWYENISKYRNHYCLGFYKKAFLNDDVKVFVEKSKGYENEHLPSTVLRWCELPKFED